MQCRSPLSPEPPTAAVPGKVSMLRTRASVARSSTAARRPSGAGSSARQSQPMAAAGRASGTCVASRHCSSIHADVGGRGWARVAPATARSNAARWSDPARHRPWPGRPHGPPRRDHRPWPGHRPRRYEWPGRQRRGEAGGGRHRRGSQHGRQRPTNLPGNPSPRPRSRRTGRQNGRQRDGAASPHGKSHRKITGAGRRSHHGERMGAVGMAAVSGDPDQERTPSLSPIVRLKPHGASSPRKRPLPTRPVASGRQHTAELMQPLHRTAPHTNSPPCQIDQPPHCDDGPGE